MSTNNTLTAKANEGAGTDALATLDLGTQGKAARVALIVDDGTDRPPNAGAANPLPVSMDGGATEATLALLKAATDALLSATASINAQAETTTTLLAAIFEKMPRVTGNDQAAVSVEGGTVAVTAVGTMTTLANQNATGGKFISGDNAMMAGAAYIYNQITVS